MQPSRADVVIVGAGIVGCATAYYLARRGLDVEVLDRGEVGAEQSSRAWGFLRQQGRHVDEIPLAIEASRIWSTLPSELNADLDLVREGILVPAETEADEQRLIDGARAVRAHGVASRLLSPREIHELIPALAGEWRAGQFTPDDGHVEPRKATRAFVAAARRAGVRIRENTPVWRVETRGGRACGVVTPTGIVGADTVVCAAGIGTAPLTRTLGHSLPIQIVRAPVAHTERATRLTDIAVWAPRAAFRPLRDGSYYIGNGYRAIDAEHDLTLDSLRHLRHFLGAYAGHRDVLRLRLGGTFVDALRRNATTRGRHAPWPEPRVNTRLVEINQRGFHELLPQLRQIGTARSWAGRIDATPDLIPVIGSLPGVPGYIVAAGFNGHGLALAPIVARSVCELIVDGRPALDLKAFRPERFAEEDVRSTSEAL